jgi:hypothetical protein
MNGPWDDHCPQRPAHGQARRTNSLTGAAGPASRVKPQRKSAYEGRLKETGRMGA